MGMAVWARLVDLSGAGQKAAIAGNGSRANVGEFGQWTDVCQQWIGVDGGIGTVIRAHRAIEPRCRFHGPQARRCRDLVVAAPPGMQL